MALTDDLTSLRATLTLVEQDVADATTALTSAGLVHWTSSSATRYQDALAAAALQLAILDPVLLAVRTSLSAADA